MTEIKFCTICNKREITSRKQYCKTCYTIGIRKGTIDKIQKPELPANLTNDQHEILIGSLLGDGCLFKYRADKNPILSLLRATKDIDYLKWEYSNFKDFCLSEPNSIEIFDKRTNKTYYQSKFATRQVPIFNNYYNEWYPLGKKIVPKNLKLTPLICAIWFCDDGCVTITKHNRIQLKLSTHGFSVDDVTYLVDLLNKRYNEKFRLGFSEKKPIIVASDNASRAFAKDIDAILPKSMDRKAKWRLPNVKFDEVVKRTKTFIVINGEYIYD